MSAYGPCLLSHHSCLHNLKKSVSLGLLAVPQREMKMLLAEVPNTYVKERTTGQRKNRKRWHSEDKSERERDSIVKTNAAQASSKSFNYDI